MLGSARPAHLNPVPSNPPVQSQLTSSSVQGPNPHILQSSPGHKVPFCPPPVLTTSLHPSLPPALNPHQHCVICVARCCHCSWQTDVVQQRDPLLDKPFEIALLGHLITLIPLGVSLHESSFVYVQAFSSWVSSLNTHEIQRFCSRWIQDPMNNCSVD